VELLTQPRTLYAGLHAELCFRLSDAQGRPLTDIAPYLGAPGHCMIVSDDHTLFMHSHPEEFMATGPDWRGGPDFTFGTLLPRAGKYRLWAQFKRGDTLIVAPFTVEVRNSPIPAPLIRFFLND
jgi:Cu+-exporting ATPase